MTLYENSSKWWTCNVFTLISSSTSDVCEICIRVCSWGRCAWCSMLQRCRCQCRYGFWLFFFVLVVGGLLVFLPALSRLADAHVRLYADIHKCRRTDRDSGRARDIKRDWETEKERERERERRETRETRERERERERMGVSERDMWYIYIYMYIYI